MEEVRPRRWPMEAVRREAKLEQSDDDGVAICPPLSLKSIYRLSLPRSSSRRRSRLSGCLACCTNEQLCYANRNASFRDVSDLVWFLLGEAATLRLPAATAMRRRGGRPPRAAASRSLSARRSAAGAPAASGSRRATGNGNRSPSARRDSSLFFGGLVWLVARRRSPTTADSSSIYPARPRATGRSVPLSPSLPRRGVWAWADRLACAAHDPAPKRHEMDRDGIGIFAGASAVFTISSAGVCLRNRICIRHTCLVSVFES